MARLAVVPGLPGAYASGMVRGETQGPRLRDCLARIPSYKAGRRPERVPNLTSYKVSSNENPYPPLPRVARVIAVAAQEVNRYPDPACSRLVDALARHADVPTSDIVVATGAVALCYQAALAAAGPGDEIVYAWRSFEAYPIVAHVAGAVPVPVGLTPDERHDLPAMLAAITPATRLIFLCTPNNPTGTTIAPAELAWFLDQAPSDVLVVVDEAYVEFADQAAAAAGTVAYRNRPNVVVLRTFSKAYGLAGLRVGYGLAQAPVAAALRKTALPFGVSNVAEAAAIASLDDHEELMDRVAALVTQRERVIAALREIGIPVPASQANFVWLRLGDAAAHFSTACDAAGLAVRLFPGEGVRVTIGETLANDRFLQLAASLAAG